jgi:hypothetical protein
MSTMNICANTDLLVGALFKKKVVSQRNAREIAKSMCCDGDIVSVNCLQRKCEKCAEKIDQTCMRMCKQDMLSLHTSSLSYRPNMYEDVQTRYVTGGTRQS